MNNTSGSSRKKLWAACAAGTAAACGAGYVYWRYRSRRSALIATRRWARVDDFPETARDTSVNLAGNLFPRGFVVTFRAPMSDVERWLAASPGTADVTPELVGTKRVYSIDPGGGAALAEVTVDLYNETVRIRAYWC